VKTLAFQTVDSPLTEDDIVMVSTPPDVQNEDQVSVESVDDDDNQDLEEEHDKTTSENTSKRSDGRPLSSTIQSKKEKEDLISCCITKVAVALVEAQQCATQDVEEEFENF
jgi:hypothetical protein